MTPYYDSNGVTIFNVDCRSLLAATDDNSIDCCVTSPPYWGLRDYGIEPSVWGDRGDCEHEWESSVIPPRHTDSGARGSTLGPNRDGRGVTRTQEQTQRSAVTYDFCQHCNAWRGSLGLEPTPQLFVEHMVSIFREVRRVLRPEGTCWLNIGDSYAGSFGAQSKREGEGIQAIKIERFGHEKSLSRRPSDFGLKPKDLCLIPFRLAIALQEDGWYVRSDIIWAKPNPMPESTKDRPTTAHEHVFLLAKSQRYYFEADAVRTPSVAPTRKMPDGWDTGPGAHGSIHHNGREKGRRTDKQRGHGRRHAGFNDRWDALSKQEQQSKGANIRTVWTIPTQPFPEAHFAVYPEKLVEPCIKAGCPEGGTVFDPFTGAGTTAVVARRFGCRFIGSELNREYCAIAVKRLPQRTLNFAEATG